mmetsp:Transcript_23123/g.34612  ORF Transcript_23123/g.34612 Transcript_23123/m.34612 type:complete len:429 (+) Transcript_23123:579-1865(+)
MLMSLVGITILAPIYASSGGNIYRQIPESIIERITATNVNVASRRLLVAFIASLSFVLFAFLCIRQYYRDIRQLIRERTIEKSNDITTCTVLLSGLPKRLTQESLLLRHLRTRFSSVLACRIPTMGNSKTKLGTGHAFVCFSSKENAQKVILAYQSSSAGPASKMLNDSGWTASPAPAPSDVIWSNLEIPRTEQMCRGLAINILLFLLMTLIIAPVAVINRLQPLLTSIEDATIPDKLKHREVRAFVGNYFPTLVVFLINSVLLPFLIELTSHFEGHHAASSRSAAVIRRNAVFQFLNTIVLPSLAINSAAEAVQLALKTNFSAWEQIIGNSLLNSSGRFYVIYLVHATMLGCAAELAQVSQTAFKTLMSTWNYLTWGSTMQMKQPWEFDFGYFYGARLTIMGLVLIYSVLVPIIAPVGAVYFLFTYW